jgi:hypothetical protein
MYKTYTYKKYEVAHSVKVKGSSDLGAASASDSTCAQRPRPLCSVGRSSGRAPCEKEEPISLRIRLERVPSGLPLVVGVTVIDIVRRDVKLRHNLNKEMKCTA